MSVNSLLTLKLANMVKELDATRPITAGNNEPDPNNHLFRSKALDIIGFNYHGVNTPNDIPAMLTVGAQYSILPSVRASLGWNHYYDKDAKMANDKQKYLGGGTDEYLAGAEWDITDRVLVSGGFQSTNYELQDKYMR